jgi:phospholipase/lecithinase/hemolysin
MHNIKSRAALLLLALLLVFLPLPQASASFTSLFVFGDGVCTTTDNSPGSALYHGNRYCNGRVWVEVLAQWQGLAYEPAKNNSFFGHDSEALVNSVNAFVAPADVATALFVVWCNDADFVNFLNDLSPPYGNVSPWTSKIDAAIARHTSAVSTLYTKGVRTIVMPKAVNIVATPFYNELAAADRTFVRLRVIDFNGKFETAMADLAATKPGLIIHRPDTFAFFEQVLANPGAFELVNPLPDNAAVLAPINHALTGPGASYIFWDDLHPTAKFQMHLAAFVQQIISPPKVNSVSLSGGNAQLQVANIPLGRGGVVQGSSNLQPPWSQDSAFTVPFVAGASTTSTVSFPASGPQRFYRVGFPVVWTWP